MQTQKWRIKKSVIEDTCAAAQNYLPDEFACLLGGNREKKIVEEIVMQPTINSRTSASMDLYNIPIDDTIIGSLHSHPSGSGKPSPADKNFFGRYPINVILSRPWSIQNTYAYNNKGAKIEVNFI